MELFDYLMAKKGHNTVGDLFSYLLGKNAGGSGTYTTFSGISLNISNTLKARIKNLKLNPTELTQTGTPTPESPVDVNVIKGDNTITISNSDNTQSQNFSINLGDLEYAKIDDYEDEIYTENGNWYLKENVGKVVLDGTETYNSIWFYPDAPRFGVSTELPNALTTSSASQFIQMYSNRFLSQKQEDLWTAGLYSDGICMRANNAQLIIKNNNISTPASSTEMINDFKNWISSHNIKIYYPMTSPIFKKITDTTLIEQLENIHNNATSYNGQTNITQTNDDLPFNISVDVKVKTE